jgi:hypothetical protein
VLGEFGLGGKEEGERDERQESHAPQYTARMGKNSEVRIQKSECRVHVKIRELTPSL